ncbi:MAG: Fic family protein [Bdellovibrionales bacterium]
MGSDILQQQREEQRFRHAIDYIHEATTGTKKLTTSELSRLNQILTAVTESSWRSASVQIKIPSGEIYKFNLISDPVDEARKIIVDAFEIANNESISAAAVFLYLQLVQHHLFQDANRRTASLAAQWLLNSFDHDIDPHELLKIPLGDVRNVFEKKKIGEKIRGLIRPR